MRATDLIGCLVYDRNGIRVGRVHDLRFELTCGDGRPFRCQLIGLDCRGSRAIGHRLGYGTGDMAGPWPLSVLFGTYYERSVRPIRWNDVARVDGRRILLRVTRTRLDEEKAG